MTKTQMLIEMEVTIAVGNEAAGASPGALLLTVRTIAMEVTIAAIGKKVASLLAGALLLTVRAIIINPDNE